MREGFNVQEAQQRVIEGDADRKRFEKMTVAKLRAELETETDTRKQYILKDWIRIKTEGRQFI